MREILFRGKCIENGEWEYGYVFDDGIIDSKRMFIGSIVITDYKGTADDKYNIDGIGFCEVIPDTICQYTGVTDKNGDKIFEGDIVKAPFLCGVTKRNITGIVEYKKGIFNFKHTEEEYGRQLLGYVDDIDVIGNIFDTPELLEEKS